MKKVVIITIISGLIATLLFGCASKEVVIDIQALANQIQKEVYFTDKLTKADQETVNELYEIDVKAYKNYAVFISTGATAEEIAIFETDAQNVDILYNAVQKRVENQKTSFENYMPNEMKKLQSPVILKKGNYVILCVCADYNKAKETISKAIG